VRRGPRPYLPQRRHPTLAACRIERGTKMGKYLIAWLLGVPGFILVLFWLFF
jgi:hypothetical protein